MNYKEITPTIVAMLLMSMLTGGAQLSLLIPYLASYQLIYNPDISLIKINYTTYCHAIGFSIGVIVTSKYCGSINPKKLIQFSCLLYSLAEFYMFFSKNYFGFLLAYILIGMSCGLMLNQFTFVLSKYMVGQPGLAAFFATLGLPFTLPLIGVIIMYITNPENQLAAIIKYEGNREVRYFDSSVAQNFPYYYLYHGLYMAAAGMILPQFIIDIYKLEVNKITVDSEKCLENDSLNTNLMKEENNSQPPVELSTLESGNFVEQSSKASDEKKSEEEMIQKIKHSMKFRVIFITATHLVATAIFFINYYKVFCQLHYDDYTATSFTPIGALCMLCGRFFYSKVIDRYGIFWHAFLYFSVEILSMFMLSTLYMYLPIFYLAWALLFINFGSQVLATLAWVHSVYGVNIGQKLMYLMGFAIIAASIYMISIDLLFNLVGYDWTFAICAIFSVLNCLLIKMVL